jgi:hypothetical protein
MSTTVSTLAELGELHLSRPGLTAPARVTAAWYERKALVLEHLAAEAGDGERYQTYARVAHAHARELLAGGGQR